eukprot:TRINITY_DN34632_c0_g1_i1.p1 TRINITY_DN34632_c0_g1~~TRINITY_DN34632_c0_g1_i1.p1  ORF type:complete len:132 (+),score=40.46 TRINITY_DN34632_c0_g1_i1:58-396(+)
MNPFGKSQYSSFWKTQKSFGSYLFGGNKKYGSKTPGYGTSFGTNFAGGVGKYGAGKKGFSKKALGLGVAAGFLAELQLVLEEPWQHMEPYTNIRSSKACCLGGGGHHYSSGV